MFINRITKKSLELFLKYSFLVTFLTRPTHFWFPDFRQNQEILSICLFSIVYKIWCFYLYQFGRYKMLNIPHTVTYTQRPIFKKSLFCAQMTSKHTNHVKTRYQKLWPNTILLLPVAGKVKKKKSPKSKILFWCT